MLLGIHLFTTGGYSIVFEYFIHQSDVQMVREIYDSKTQKKLIEIKIPVHLPGMHAWNRYEHIEGQVQVKGTFYNYVRLKMSADTMAMLCIPNTVKTHLVNANVILTKEITDTPMSKKGHDLVKKSIDLQYVYQALNYQFSATPVFIKKEYNNTYSCLLNPFVETRGQPPDFRC
ncbi:hypothetical protein [Mucilaginibacter agri]|uniref:Uncharacterized protein n=1 Tax=Mucilaginibacter agri TaxID=2695265 RepID=A0A966DU27_9SPHI|nr:hypothetical protein [Mucilaginibacter agri]NCD70001.1 hypothetical protein [Mucilaginibacter agri]